MNAAQFQQASRKLFRFLEDDFGCRPVEPPPEATSLPPHLRGYFLRYENQTTGVSVHLEPPEQLPVVHIQELGGSKEAHSLGMLLLAVAPHLNPLASERGLPLRQSARTLLQKYAEALKSVGPGLLRGDFEVFPRLRALRDLESQRRLAGQPPLASY